MVFQENALFDSLTVAQNVAFRLTEEAEMSEEEIDARVAEVLGFVGLTDFAERMPSALSGGQRRRVGIARAMASKPKLLLFDDPITGLDPLIATDIDHEIVKLRDLEDVTAFVVTHQIRDAFYIAEHKAETVNGKVEVVKTDSSQISGVCFMVLHEGAIMFQGSASELLAARERDPYLKEYLYKTLPPW
jgi:phospholipid/cholesterol/gamma-HCH transport system ATP-binding protein